MYTQCNEIISAKIHFFPQLKALCQEDNKKRFLLPGGHTATEEILIIPERQNQRANS